jgi:hypothetical protein
MDVGIGLARLERDMEPLKLEVEGTDHVETQSPIYLSGNTSTVRSRKVYRLITCAETQSALIRFTWNW